MRTRDEEEREAVSKPRPPGWYSPALSLSYSRKDCHVTSALVMHEPRQSLQRATPVNTQGEIPPCVRTNSLVAFELIH